MVKTWLIKIRAAVHQSLTCGKDRETNCYILLFVDIMMVQISIKLRHCFVWSANFTPSRALGDMTKSLNETEGTPSTRPQRRFREVSHCEALSHQGRTDRLGQLITSTHSTSDASERPSRFSSITLFHRTSVSTSAIFGDPFYGLKDLLYPKSTSQPRLRDLLHPKSYTLPLPVLVNKWFSSVSTHSPPLPHCKDHSCTVSRLHDTTH